MDTKELIRFFANINGCGIILGGWFSKMNEILDYFLGEMKREGADLVFIGRLKKKHPDQYLSMTSTYDCIMQNNSLENHVNRERYLFSNLRPAERITYNLMHSICQKYGQLYIVYGLCKRSILRYTKEHRVMAVMTRNTEFFAHDCDFQYWNLSDVQFCDLKITRFDRQQLMEKLGLSIHEMQLLFAISQLSLNDKRRLYGRDWFLEMVEYVKHVKCEASDFDANQLPGLTDDYRNEVANELTHIRNLSSYNGDWNEDLYQENISNLIKSDENFNAVLMFCKEHIYFSYKLINEKYSTHHQSDLLFIDDRKPEALPFIEAVSNVTMKLLGILFKDVDSEKQPKTRTVEFRRNVDEEITEFEMDMTSSIQRVNQFHF